MTLFKNEYRIESTRLKEWDYSTNAYYYITICAEGKEKIFGSIINGEPSLNINGKIITDSVNKLPEVFTGLEICEYIVMPDHLHAIIRICNKETRRDGGGAPSLRKTNLADVVRSFKSFTTNEINKARGTRDKIWQKNYWDRIIRDDIEYFFTQEYIRNNPLADELGYTDYQLFEEIRKKKEEMGKDKPQEKQP